MAFDIAAEAAVVDRADEVRVVNAPIADLALAAKVVELAREQGRGQEIELPEPGSV